MRLASRVHKSAGPLIWTAERPEHSEGEAQGRAESILATSTNTEKPPSGGFFCAMAAVPPFFTLFYGRGNVRSSQLIGED